MAPAPSHAARSKAMLREAVLDAAYDAVVHTGWEQARMGTIAAAAGVSRQTVYNEFGSKSGLALALLMRRSEAFLAGVQTALDGHPDDFGAGVVDAVEYTLRRAADDPLLKTILTSARHDEFLGLLTTRSQPVLMSAVATLTAYARSHWPELDPERVETVAEAAVRLTNSHIVLPTEPVEITARTIAMLVETFLHADTPEVNQ